MTEQKMHTHSLKREYPETVDMFGTCCWHLGLESSKKICLYRPAMGELQKQTRTL